ncbi:GntR family transcriptional regulator [Siculibacillus lacustris]|uniref:GntR family transcriptional regulator n=1 Tax=Siculibacillus lacustris TaxID=1549641 RepID=A0A4Q9VW21_9HYPH|nr:GntR family transcriptional regulator [Siculibacillus lacustris]
MVEEVTDNPHARLADQVFDRLLQDIVVGALPPGTPVSELDLCDRLKVSRTPVREALIRLAEVSLVRIRPQRGTFVAPISPSAFRNSQFIREHLECALVAEAVRYIDSTSLRDLADILDRQEEVARSGVGTDFYAPDEIFHRTIARIARREEVWLQIRATKVHFDRVRHLTLQEDVGHIPLLIEQHREVYNGLAECNEIQAVAAMRRHLREIFRRAEGIFERHVSDAESELGKVRRGNKTREKRTEYPV